MSPTTQHTPAARTTPYVVLLSAVAALGGLLFGFDTAVIAGTLPFIAPFFGLGETALGWAVSSVILGAMAGLLFAGRLSDRYGRKRVLLGTAAAFALSAVGTAVADSFAFFVAARMLGGMAVGTASMLSPLYIAEIAPPARRGQLVALNQLTIVVGILVAFFSNYLLVGTGADNWRWMFGVETAPAFVFFVALLFVPESPRWLVSRGREEEAARVLTRVRGGAGVEAELADIRSVAADPRRERLADLLEPALRPLLGIAVALAVFQQITGINVVMYYAPIIFERAGAATDAALLQTIAIGVVNLTFTLVAMWLIDRMGRRPLLLAGAAGMALALAFLSGAFLLGRTGGAGVLGSILVYVGCFAASLGPVVWVVLSEIFPMRVRGLAMAAATFVLWTANFVVSLTFPWLLARLDGGLTFALYALACLATLAYVWRFVPETKGKSLEELERALAKSRESPIAISSSPSSS